SPHTYGCDRWRFGEFLYNESMGTTVDPQTLTKGKVSKGHNLLWRKWGWREWGGFRQRRGLGGGLGGGVLGGGGGGFGGGGGRGGVRAEETKKRRRENRQKIREQEAR